MTEELDGEDVGQVYRLLLHREPETQNVVRQHARSHKNVLQFVAAVLRSEEYRKKHVLYRDAVGQIYRQLPQRIDLHPTPDQTERMFARVQHQWTTLGETEPHWGVLTDPRYRAASIDQNKREFFQSGRYDAENLETFSARSGLATPRGVCLELGCGVGRATRFLADKFDRVIGLDISAGNLAVCREHLISEGISNVELIQIRSVDDFLALPNFDFFYSFIVLQHNPPPIQRVILEAIFSKILPGGGCLFQTSAWSSHYHFDIEKYLGSPEPVMEEHCLTMSVVLGLMSHAGLRAVEVLPDNWLGRPGSFTYFATKNEAR